jgi:acetyl esterase
MREIPWPVRLRGLAARWIGRRSTALQRALTFGAPIHVDGQTLDPTLQLFLRLRPVRDDHPLTAGTPPQGRLRHRHEVLSVRGASTPVGEVRELTVDGAAGPLRARWYVPPGAERPATLTLYFHGGGFALGDLDTLDEPCRLLCVHARHHVLSIEYRLAPEHPFPAPTDDAEAAFRWAQQHATEFGVTPDRIAVAGDSAGGNLAAVVARRTATDRPPLAQLLIYPVLDRTTVHPSARLFDGFFLTRADGDAFARWYYELAGAPPDEPRISPLASGPWGGLPPALIVAAGFDILRDEALGYAARLRSAGTPVHLQFEPSLVHGFAQVTGASGACRSATVRFAQKWGAFVDALPVKRPAHSQFDSTAFPGEFVA